METVVLSREVNGESWDIEFEEITIPVASLPEHLDSYKWYAAAAESEGWTAELVHQAFTEYQRHIIHLLPHKAVSADVILKFLREHFKKSEQYPTERRWDYLSNSFITASQNPNLTPEVLDVILGGEFDGPGIRRRNLLIAFIDNPDIPPKFFDEALEISDDVLFEYLVRNPKLPLYVIEQLAEKASTINQDIYARLFIAHTNLPEKLVDLIFKKVDEANSEYLPELFFESVFDQANVSEYVLRRMMNRTRSTLIVSKLAALPSLPEHVYWCFFNQYIADGPHKTNPLDYPDLTKFYEELAHNQHIPIEMLEYFGRDASYCDFIIPTLKERFPYYQGMPDEWVQALLPFKADFCLCPDKCQVSHA